MDEIDVLSGLLVAEKIYHKGRIDSVSLRRRIGTGNATVLREGGNIICFGALWPTNALLVELGTIYVHPDKRGNGYQQEIVNGLLALVPGGMRPFFITHNGCLMKRARQNGFAPITTGTYPDILMCAVRAGIVCRLPPSIHSEEAIPVPGERWFFMR